jgi:hypothetical protein
MKFKEILRREKEEMNPIRFRMNWIVLPVFCVLFLAGLIAIAIVGEYAAQEWLCLIPAGGVLLLAVALLIYSILLVKKEEETELGRWGYLFNKDILFEAETLETEDPETGLQYTLGARGIKVVLPIQGEQVFDECIENEYFLPWDDVEIALATDNFARRVRIALAVVDVSKRSVDGDYVPEENEVHFLPMEEELVGFIRKHALEEKISVEWRYILAQPKDAFHQILAFGYIKTLLDKNGKRIKRMQAEELYKG